MSENRAGRLIFLYSDRHPEHHLKHHSDQTDHREAAYVVSGEYKVAPPYLSAMPHGKDLSLLNDWLGEFLELDNTGWPGLSEWEDGASGALHAEGIHGKVLAHGLPSDLFICAECGSTFDVAWALAAHGVLPEWGAVLALRQISGRGQMRREWLSPAGNLHVSFRLPERFLQMEAAPVVTASLLVETFAMLGLELSLKWPNDLVMRSSGEDGALGKWGKLGGILLEERGGLLLAGLGLNLAHCPAESALRKDAAMPAVIILQSFTPKTPISLWLELVQNMILLYEKTFQTTPTAILLRQSEKYLLWKGSEVQVRDHNDSGSAVTGILCGLTELGGLRLLVPSRRVSQHETYAGGQPGSPGAPSHLNGQRSGLPECASGSRNPFGFEELELYSGSLKGTD